MILFYSWPLPLSPYPIKALVDDPAARRGSSFIVNLLLLTISPALFPFEKQTEKLVVQ